MNHRTAGDAAKPPSEGAMREPGPSSQVFAPAARVFRGTGIDAVHAAAIAVVDEGSNLSWSLGDPDQAFFTRSSIKPLQALPLVRRGVLERFGFGNEQLALACASHNGTDRHRAIVADMLSRIGSSAAALQCGAHLPYAMRFSGTPALNGEDRDPLRHNCSGKHAGFLALAAALGDPAERYLDRDGAVQSDVRGAVAEACELEVAELAVATDGCSAPNFAMPLRNLAVGFKNLARGVAGQDARIDRQRVPGANAALERVRTAMLADPWLISGDNRLDYDLARAFPGVMVNKGGAEALIAIGLVRPVMGIAIKVLDGADRALGCIVVETLKQLGLVNRMDDVPTLQRHEQPPVLNFRKVRTGEIRAELRLQRH